MVNGKDSKEKILELQIVELLANRHLKGTRHITEDSLFIARVDNGSLKREQRLGKWISWLVIALVQARLSHNPFGIQRQIEC